MSSKETLLIVGVMVGVLGIVLGFVLKKFILSSIITSCASLLCLMSAIVPYKPLKK